MMVKYSISITELALESSQQNSRVHLMLADLDENPANKKVITVMYLSLGEETVHRQVSEHCLVGVKGSAAKNYV